MKPQSDQGYAMPKPTAPTYDFAPQDAAVLLRWHAQILELVAAAAPLRDMLEGIIVALEELIPDACCSILLLDRSGTTLHHGAAPHLPSDYLSFIDGMQVGPFAGSCGAAAYLNERVVATDVRTDPRWIRFRAKAVLADVVSCWSTPIAGRSGAPIGTFAVYHREPHQPSLRELHLVDRFTYLASVAIEHSKVVGDLVESEELFRRTFEDNAVGTALLGLDRTVQRVNRAMIRLTGFDAAELTGRSIAAVLDLADEPEAQDLVASLLRGQVERITRQTRLIRKDGHRLPVEATASIVRGTDGEPRLLALNLLDLTERQAVELAVRARREAEVARRTAEEHSRAKSELLTAVSHEVRTPLQAITGFTELLATLELDEPRREEALRQINRAAEHLLELVTDVLDISRIEAEVLPLRPEDVCVAAAVRDAVDLIASEAGAREVAVHMRVDDELTARADRRRLAQILLNLIGNGVQHGHSGGHVEISARTDGDAALITVTDDGPGIPEDLLPHLFTPFLRGNSSDVDGYGLGLMLSSGLATVMGGDLSARNIPGRGASFQLQLPRGRRENCR